MYVPLCCQPSETAEPACSAAVIMRPDKTLVLLCLLLFVSASPTPEEPVLSDTPADGRLAANTYNRLSFDYAVMTVPPPGLGACAAPVSEDIVAFVAGGDMDLYSGTDMYRSHSEGVHYWADAKVWVRNMKTKNGYYVAISQGLAVTAATCHAMPRQSGQELSKVVVFGGAQGNYTVLDGVTYRDVFDVSDNLVVVDLNKDGSDVTTVVKKYGAWPPARAFHAWAADESQTKLYMYGGSGPFHLHGDNPYGDVFNDVWELDTLTFTWREFKAPEDAVMGVNWPKPRRGHIMNVVPETEYNRRKILMFGGCRTAAVDNSLRAGCFSVDGVNATVNDLWTYTPDVNEWTRIPENFTEDVDEYGIYRDGGWPSPRAFMTSYAAVGSKSGEGHGLVGMFGGNVASWKVDLEDLQYDVPQAENWYEFDYTRKKWVKRPQKSSESSKAAENISVLDAHRFATLVIHGGTVCHFNDIRYVEPSSIIARATGGMISLSRYLLDWTSYDGGNAVQSGVDGANSLPVLDQSYGVISNGELAIFGGTVRSFLALEQNQWFYERLDSVLRMHSRNRLDGGNNASLNNPKTWEFASLYNPVAKWPRVMSSYGPNGLAVLSGDYSPDFNMLPDICQVDDKKQVVRYLYRGRSFTSECFDPVPGYEDENLIHLGPHSPTVMWTGDDSDLIYMFGGDPPCYEGKYSNQLLTFDPILKRWSNITLASMAATPKGMYPPASLNGRGVSGAGGLLMYLFGGYEDNGRFSSDLYALVTNKVMNREGVHSFRYIPPKPASVEDRVPPALLQPSFTRIKYQRETDGTWLVVLGGQTTDFEMSDTMYMFDIFTEKWRSLELAGEPRSRAAHAAVWNEDAEILYVFGGQITEKVNRNIPTNFMCTEVAAIRPDAKVNEFAHLQRACISSLNYCADRLVFDGCDQFSYAATSGSSECTPCPEGTERGFHHDIVCNRVSEHWCSHGRGYVDERGAPQCVCSFGYDGSRCDSPTWAYVTAISLAIFVALACLSGSFYLVYNRLTRKTLAKLNAYKQLQQRMSKTKSSTEKWDLKADDIHILGRVGSGASAIVYRGRWHGHDVAVKEFVDITENAQSLEREMDMLTSLNHPNIIRFWGCSMNRCYVVMEYCSRGTLDELIHSTSLVQSAAEYDIRARKAIIEIARGMHYLHSLQPPVLHRDLKPENVLVDENWVVKIGDFGLSKRLDPDEKYMTRGAGTPSYCAPEVWERVKDGDNPYSTANFTTKADVFSFGIMLHEIMFRERPFGDCTFAVEVTQRIARGERPNTSLQNMARARNMYSLMERCWHANPDERPEFGEIVAILDTATVWSS